MKIKRIIFSALLIFIFISLFAGNIIFGIEAQMYKEKFNFCDDYLFDYGRVMDTLIRQKNDSIQILLESIEQINNDKFQQPELRSTENK